MTTHEIKLKIHEEADLFSPLDPDQAVLSEDVVSYISHNYLSKHRSNREKYTVQIFSDKPADEEHVKKSFKEYFLKEKDTLNYSLKKLTQKEICLGIFGILVLALWLFLSIRSEGVHVEILSIMGWVAIWEATSIAIMERPELNRIKMGYEELIRSDIHIHVNASPM